jgi:hypothetical protein
MSELTIEELEQQHEEARDARQLLTEEFDGIDAAIKSALRQGAATTFTQLSTRRRELPFLLSEALEIEHMRAQAVISSRARVQLDQQAVVEAAVAEAQAVLKTRQQEVAAELATLEGAVRQAEQALAEHFRVCGGWSDKSGEARTFFLSELQRINA